MMFRLHLCAVALALLLIGLGGSACRSHPQLGTEPRAVSTSGTEVESPKDAEKRVEAHAHYAMGVLHELNDETDDAIQAYTKSLELDPGNEPLLLELSRKLIQQKRYAKAEELLARATARPNASATLFARLGVAYYFLGKKDQAIAANNTALRKNPRLVAAYQNLLQLHLQASQYEEALKVLERASAVPDPEAGFLIDVAELYIRYARVPGGDRDKFGKQRALEILDRVVALDSANPVTQQRIAETYVRLGESPKAIAIYLKLLEQSADPISVRERLAELYLASNNPVGATQQLEAIASENPSLQTFYELGSIASAQNKYRIAAGYFGKALEQLTPELEQIKPGLRQEIYFDLAGAQINGDQAREALATLDKTRASFSRSFLTEFYAGMAFAKMKDFTNAVARFAEAESLVQGADTNRLHILYFQFGAACERSHQFGEAEVHFKKALELKPDSAETLNYLGYMWAERGEHLGEAREMIEKALKLDPDNAAYIDSLGWVLFKLNRPREALTHIQRAVELSPEPDATLYDHLGDIQAAINQPDKAREAWRKSLELEPNDNIRKKIEPARPAKVSPR